MGKRTAGPSETTASTDQQSDHERNAATQHQHNDSLRGDKHRRSGTRFKFRHKPRGPNSLYDDHCPSSHVFDHVPTCALLLAGLLAICVGSVPVEANPSGAWIARPSRNVFSATTISHSTGALGDVSCTVTTASASAGDSSVNQHSISQLSHHATFCDLRPPAPLPRPPESMTLQPIAQPSQAPPHPARPNAATVQPLLRAAAIHPSNPIPSDISPVRWFPGPAKGATDASDPLGKLAAAQHHPDSAVQRAGAAPAKVPWALPKYRKTILKKKAKKTRNRIEIETAFATVSPAGRDPLVPGNRSSFSEAVRCQQSTSTPRALPRCLRRAGIRKHLGMISKRACLDGVGSTMEQDMLRSPPPPSGPRPLQSALPHHRTATPGASGLSPEATGGQTNAEATASNAPGPSPGAMAERGSWNVAGATGTHTQAANGTLLPRPHQAITPDAPGPSPGATGGRADTTSAPGLSPGATGSRTTTTSAPGPSPGAMAGLPSNYYPCWGSLTALIEPDGIDLFRARLLQLHVAHKWQWFIRVDPVDQAALAAIDTHTPGLAKATTPHPSCAVAPDAPGPSPGATGCRTAMTGAPELSLGAITGLQSSTPPPEYADA